MAESISEIRGFLVEWDVVLPAPGRPPWAISAGQRWQHLDPSKQSHLKATRVDRQRSLFDFALGRPSASGPRRGTALAVRSDHQAARSGLGRQAAVDPIARLRQPRRRLLEFAAGADNFCFPVALKIFSPARYPDRQVYEEATLNMGRVAMRRGPHPAGQSRLCAELGRTWRHPLHGHGVGRRPRPALS